MQDSREQIIPLSIEDEMRTSYLDYAMSVIVGRALPDVRDGLKPVHRRILYAMYTGGYRANRAHNKSAKIVGEVMGKFHPHGDSAIYDTLVRLAQDWNMRYPLVDGQGNFGSVDGDPPAAMRYTETRLLPLGEALLTDIDKSTVDFMPNYDGKEMEPVVLPAAFPNLMTNGAEGIAVGMATKIPPHNLGELVDALVALIDKPKTTLEEILTILPGPDFPTGGYILGRSGIIDAYRTGRGKVVMRARMRTEQLKGNREAIIITEIPFQVNKSRLVADIAQLTRDKKLLGISEIRDESDRDGMRIVIEVRRGEAPEVIINNLYKHTNLQTSFGVILLAIVNNQPRYLSLLRALKLYIDHRREVLLRGTRHDLNRALERLHIVEGLLIALSDIDEIVHIIRSSKDVDEARERLMDSGLVVRLKRKKDSEAARSGLLESYEHLSKRQADAILEMRLRTLTALEVGKLAQERKELRELIDELESILASEKKQFSIIKRDLLEIKKRFADPRRSEIINDPGEMTIEDLIAIERMVITISHQGYIKRTDTELYRRQRRGGKGVVGAETKDEDWVEHLFIGTTHDYLMFFTDRGVAYWLKVYELPQAGRASKGRPIVNLLEGFQKGEQIESVVPVSKFEEGHFLVFITRQGRVQRNSLDLYSNPRKVGIKAINIQDGDELVKVALTNGDQDIFIATRKGMAVRFHETDVRAAGRFTQGVAGISLQKGDYVVGAEVLRPNSTILTVCEKGIGKRSNAEDYRLIKRGGKGVINIRVTPKNGEVAGIIEVSDKDEVIAVTDRGQTIRCGMGDFRVIGRATQGVRLFNVNDGDRITAISRVEPEEEDPGDGTDEGEGQGEGDMLET
ncbi:MAG: gyrase subunit [Candidatus Sumerlaeota bacterium]|nr:gyrase subunit [Candidatus Sumerlaeota bacterium]